jgi:2-polyprenyl-3-methyl-5-hydroxy-6-metoxy-1,4-benzoquinol methylase
MTAPSAPSLASPEELVGRLLEATVSALDVFSVYVGEQMGYYRALHEGGPATSAELAQRTGAHERYVREWLEQQATTGLLAVDNPAAGAAARRYRLPEGYGEVLVNPESELFVAPVGRFLTASVRRASDLLNAYRTGGGVSWSQFGDEARTAQADFNRPFFQNSLVPGYLSQIPGLDAALKAPGARVAEIGFGGGWASIAIAKAYPSATIEGYDIDEPSAELARRNAAGAGVGGRTNFHAQDAGKAAGEGQFDLVCAFECIHDMPDPVSVLAAMRRLAKPGAVVLVMDENVGEEFGNIGDLAERLFYGFSLAVCLPDGMSHQPSVGTGTVMRPATLKQYAKEAGFSDVEVLPLEHDLFRFYRLIQ